MKGPTNHVTPFLQSVTRTSMGCAPDSGAASSGGGRRTGNMAGCVGAARVWGCRGHAPCGRRPPRRIKWRSTCPLKRLKGSSEWDTGRGYCGRMRRGEPALPTSGGRRWCCDGGGGGAGWIPSAWSSPPKSYNDSGLCCCGCCRLMLERRPQCSASSSCRYRDSLCWKPACCRRRRFFRFPALLLGPSARWAPGSTAGPLWLCAGWCGLINRSSGEGSI